MAKKKFMKKKKLKKLLKFQSAQISGLMKEVIALIERPDSVEAQAIRSSHYTRRDLEKALWAGSITGREKEYSGFIVRGKIGHPDAKDPVRPSYTSIILE